MKDERTPDAANNAGAQLANRIRPAAEPHVLGRAIENLLTILNGIAAAAVRGRDEAPRA